MWSTLASLMSSTYTRAHCNGVDAATTMLVGNCYVRFRRQIVTLEWPPKRFYVMRVNNSFAQPHQGKDEAEALDDESQV